MRLTVLLKAITQRATAAVPTIRCACASWAGLPRAAIARGAVCEKIFWMPALLRIAVIISWMPRGEIVGLRYKMRTSSLPSRWGPGAADDQEAFRYAINHQFPPARL